MTVITRTPAARVITMVDQLVKAELIDPCKPFLVRFVEGTRRPVLLAGEWTYWWRVDDQLGAYRHVGETLEEHIVSPSGELVPRRVLVDQPDELL